MSLILQLDTSISNASLVLSNEGGILSVQRLSAKESVSEQLTVLIEKAFLEANKKFADLAAVAVNTGPGSYTSLRVGFSIAKGLCYTLNIPLIGLDAFEILFSASKKEMTNYDAILCMVDARRMDAYMRMYLPADEKLNETEFITFDQHFVDRFADQKVLCTGDGAFKLKDCNILPAAWHISPIIQDASLMTDLSLDKFSSQLFLETAYSTPYYFKQPNITNPKNTF